jgi:hypothetical protein
VVAYEAGRDGFWLARLLQGHGIETHVIRASSVAVSREQRRASYINQKVSLTGGLSISGVVAALRDLISAAWYSFR